MGAVLVIPIPKVVRRDLGKVLHLTQLLPREVAMEGIGITFIQEMAVRVVDQEE
jgi:hypothetical protein